MTIKLQEELLNDLAAQINTNEFITERLSMQINNVSKLRDENKELETKLAKAIKSSESASFWLKDRDQIISVRMDQLFEATMTNSALEDENAELKLEIARLKKGTSDLDVYHTEIREDLEDQLVNQLKENDKLTSAITKTDQIVNALMGKLAQITGTRQIKTFKTIITGRK